jgi:hypothetical protein
MDLSGNCFDEISFEICSPDSEFLYGFDLESCSKYFKSEFNINDELSSELYKFNHCSAFEFSKNKYVIAFRIISNVKEIKMNYQFSIWKIFKTLRKDQWYYDIFDKIKEKILKNKKKITYFIRQTIKLDNANFTLENFIKICDYLNLIKKTKEHIQSSNACQVFMDDIENYSFENVEDLRNNNLTFKEKSEEYKRINFLKHRSKLESIFDNFFELKLFFGWITSFQLKIDKKEFFFLFCDEYLQMVKHLQE